LSIMKIATNIYAGKGAVV